MSAQRYRPSTVLGTLTLTVADLKRELANTNALLAQRNAAIVEMGQEIERLKKLEAEAARLGRWVEQYLPGDSAIVTAHLICDVIKDNLPAGYEPPEWT